RWNSRTASSRRPSSSARGPSTTSPCSRRTRSRTTCPLRRCARHPTWPCARVRSTSDVSVGDEVIAVGFPFGIGPSVSSGVVSGLGRVYRSRSGDALANLIQFGAAVNPVNAGGPLVTADGEVVGIVTAILNPTEQHVFIGIGFAVPIENAAAAYGLSPF